MLGSGGMVSQIGWILTMGSYEDSVSTTIDKPKFVETTCANSGIWEYDASPEVLVVLVLVEWRRLHQPGLTSGGKDGFNANLRERRGKGFFYSMMIDLF